MTRRGGLAVLGLVCALSVLTAGCSSGGSDEPGADASYTAELCEAMNDTNIELEKLAAKSANLGFEKLAAGVAEILDDLADSLAEASPPGDLEEWNKDAVKAIRSAASNLTKSQKSASLDVLGDSPLPDPPAPVRARIDAAARDIPACRGLSLFGE